MNGECGNAEMRDRLPDLLHGRLPEPERAHLQAHLHGCADCRDELALLQRVRVSAPRVAVDSGRILAALPAYRLPSVWNRAARSPLLRIAAVLVAVVGGSMLVHRRTAEAPDHAMSAPTPVTTPATPIIRGATSQVAVRPVQAQPAELGIGEIDDLTDAELEALLSAMETLEASTSVEPEVVVPAVSRGGA